MRDGLNYRFSIKTKNLEMFSVAVPVLEITSLHESLNVLCCIFGKKENRPS